MVSRGQPKSLLVCVEKVIDIVIVVALIVVTVCWPWICFASRKGNSKCSEKHVIKLFLQENSQKKKAAGVQRIRKSRLVQYRCWRSPTITSTLLIWTKKNQNNVEKNITSKIYWESVTWNITIINGLTINLIVSQPEYNVQQRYWERCLK